MMIMKKAYSKQLMNLWKKKKNNPPKTYINNYWIWSGRKNLSNTCRLNNKGVIIKNIANYSQLEIISNGCLRRWRTGIIGNKAKYNNALEKKRGTRICE